MKAITTLLILFFTLGVLIPDSDARRRRKRKRKPKVLKATKQTKLGIKKLMAGVKWNMKSSTIMDQLESAVRKRLVPALKKTKDPMLQDRRRREMMAEIKKVRKNHVTFTGKRTAWDVSLIDKEFAHKNSESLAVSWRKKERRFFFFHNERLYKVFIAFNADMFQGKSFEDFATAMESRFGKAERKFTTTLKGDAKMDHMAWPQAGDTIMMAYDFTGFYGNFCLILLNKGMFESVKEGRVHNSPKRNYSDPLVTAVTKGDANQGDSNENIVDQITGKTTKRPKVNDSSSPGTTSPGSSSGGSSYDPPSKPKKNKRINPKNPLDGLDI